MSDINNDHNHSQPSTVHQELIETHNSYIATESYPQEYDKFGFDCPAFISDLEVDLDNMSNLRKTACFDSIVNKMQSVLDRDKIRLENISTPPLRVSLNPTTRAYTFAIGHKIDFRNLPHSHNAILYPHQQLILDSEITAIYPNERKSTRDNVPSLEDDIRDYDYITLFRIIDREQPYESVQRLDSDLFAYLLKKHLYTRKELLATDEEKYKRIYAQKVDRLVNEHFNKRSEGR